MRLLSFIPVLLCGTLVALLRQWRQSLVYFRFSQDGQLRLPQRWLLAASSAALARNLAGPLYYGHEKQRRVRIGPATEPQSSDIRIWLNLCRQLQIASFMLIASVWLLLLVSIFVSKTLLLLSSIYGLCRQRSRYLIARHLIAVALLAVSGRRPATVLLPLTTEQGLSRGSINKLYLDRQGFLWIATSNGLNR